MVAGINLNNLYYTIKGNSVGVDMNFINVHMPKLSAFLHYRVIDVSSIKELCRRWNPDLFYKLP